MSLRNLFMLVAFVAVPSALFACSSTTGGTSTGGGTTTTKTGSGGHTTTTTTSGTTTTTTMSCKMTGDGGTMLCQQCCATAHQTGYATFAGLVLANCACDPAGACHSACGADGGTPAFCAGPDAGTPSAACQQCIGGEEAKGASSACLVKAATSSSCTGDCSAFVGCGQGC